SVVRAVRRQLLTDTLSPRIIARCAPEEALIAHPLAARLGPRAVIQADAAIPPGRERIEEG
ncbi:RNA-binding protein, partial [Enterococcus faecium]